MANPGYVRSTDGNDADNGSTWALANATLAGAMADQAAGDRIFVSGNHAESAAAAITITLPGTLAAPNQVLCGNDAAEPPTALATSGSVTTTGANGVTLAGSGHIYGLNLNCGTGAGTVNCILSNTSGGHQSFDACNFSLLVTGASKLYLGNSSGFSRVDIKNCGFKFAAENQGIQVRGMARISGGSLLSGGTSPTTLFLGNTGVPSDTVVDGLDLTNAAAAINLVSGAPSGPGRCIFRNCKLPASWSGSLFTGAAINSFRAEMWNCDSADTNYRLWVEDYCGSIKSETTLVKTGGASDGDTPLAWKMATSANAEYPVNVLRSPEIASERITAVGAAKTITVDILHDSATSLKDDEVWLEVQYLGTSGMPLGAFANDAKADVLAAAADQTASSATWTTTGMTNPNKQKLEVSFTPQEKGVALVTVCVAKASYTVYVDPVAQVG